MTYVPPFSQLSLLSSGDQVAIMVDRNRKIEIWADCFLCSLHITEIMKLAGEIKSSETVIRAYGFKKLAKAILKKRGFKTLTHKLPRVKKD